MHKTILIILTVLVIAIAGGDIGFFRLYKMKKINIKVRKIENEVASLEIKVRQIPQLRSEVKTLELEEDKFKEKLPTEQEASVDSFWKVLASYAKSSKCEITRLAKKVIPQTPDMESLPFTIITFEVSIQGNFFDAVRFISMLENQKRLVNIETFQIHKHPSVQQEITEYTAIPIVFSTYKWKN